MTKVIVNKKSLKYWVVFVLLFVVLLASLTSPKMKVFSVPVLMLLPLPLSLLVYLLNGCYLSRKVAIFTLIIFLAAFLGTVHSVTSDFFSMMSFLLTIASMAMFLINTSALSRVLTYFRNEDIEPLIRWFIYFFILIFCIEIIVPDLFIKLRIGLYGTGYDFEAIAKRDDLLMFGHRPFFIFTESSAAARYTGVLLGMYAFLDKFSNRSAFLIVLMFVLLRSPSLGIVLYVVPFYFIRFFTVMKWRGKLIFLSAVVIGGISLGITIAVRVQGYLDVGSGSISERYVFPLFFLFQQNLDVIFSGFGFGGHKEMYGFICSEMASTRPLFECGNNPHAAASSAIMFLGVFGIVGLVLFISLNYLSFGLSGLMLVYIFFVVEFFMTGFNSPISFSVLVFPVAQYFAYIHATKFESVKSGIV